MFPESFPHLVHFNKLFKYQGLSVEALSKLTASVWVLPHGVCTSMGYIFKCKRPTLKKIHIPIQIGSSMERDRQQIKAYHVEWSTSATRPKHTTLANGTVVLEGGWEQLCVPRDSKLHWDCYENATLMAPLYNLL